MDYRSHKLAWRFSAAFVVLLAGCQSGPDVGEVYRDVAVDEDSVLRFRNMIPSVYVVKEMWVFSATDLEDRRVELEQSSERVKAAIQLVDSLAGLDIFNAAIIEARQ